MGLKDQKVRGQQRISSSHVPAAVIGWMSQLKWLRSQTLCGQLGLYGLAFHAHQFCVFAGVGAEGHAAKGATGEHEAPDDGHSSDFLAREVAGVLCAGGAWGPAATVVVVVIASGNDDGLLLLGWGWWGRVVDWRGWWGWHHHGLHHGLHHDWLHDWLHHRLHHWLHHWLHHGLHAHSHHHVLLIITSGCV